jgi:hypothetical protein
VEELEQKIIATLRRFAAIDRETLKRETLAGYFTFAAERQFDLCLLKLRDAGQVQNSGGLFGRWWIPTPPVAAAAVECAAPAARSEPKKATKSARK